MTTLITTDFAKLFSISIKQRTDNYTDQYNRIFMVKVLLACTIVMGASWYTDSVKLYHSRYEYYAECLLCRMYVLSYLLSLVKGRLKQFLDLKQ